MRSGVNVLVKRHTKEKHISLRDACDKALRLQNKLNKAGTIKARFMAYNNDLDNLKSKISLILLENANNFDICSILTIGRNKFKTIVDDLEQVIFTYEYTRPFQTINISIKPVIGKSNKFFVTVKCSNKELGCYGSNSFAIEEDEFNEYISIVNSSRGDYEARIGRNRVKVKSNCYKVFEVKTYFNNNVTMLNSI